MGFRSFLHRITAPRFERAAPGNQPLKMVFVVNHALKMGKGKIAAQVGHAAVKATLKSGEVRPELLVKINDAGHTQIPSGSLTVLALGPEEEEKLDELTGELKLL